MIRCQRVRARKLEVSAANSNEWLWPAGGRQDGMEGFFLWQKIKVPGFCTIMGGKTGQKTKGRVIEEDPAIQISMDFASLIRTSIIRPVGPAEAGVNIYVSLTPCLQESSTNYGHVSALPDVHANAFADMIPRVLQEMNVNWGCEQRKILLVIFRCDSIS